MRILCTGGAGFIGSNTVEILERNGNKVLVVDNMSTGNPANIQFMKGRFALVDITDAKLLNAAFEDFSPDAVLHLAAQSAISTSMSDPVKDLTVNAIGTLNVLQAALKYGVKRFVFASTSAVYREEKTWWGMSEKFRTEPSSPYGISKLACEGYVRTMFPNHMILRYANIYGRRQVAIGENQVVARAFAHFIEGDPFKIVGHGNQKRDYVYVEDIAYCNLDALICNVTGTFNAASGKSYSVNELMAEIERACDVRGYKWEHTGKEDPRGDVFLNSFKIQRAVGWRPRHNLASGIQKTWQWWENGRKSVYGVTGTP